MNRKLSDFEPLSPAEQQIRDEICSEPVVTLGDGRLPPEGAGEGRQVRADFLRYLILGGCAALPGAIPEHGVRIKSALVTGDLDLYGARIGRDVALLSCRFDMAPDLRSTRLDTLNLTGSALPGLNADRLRAEGSVFLRDVRAMGELRLLAATLGGGLDCDRARLEAGESGKALNADGLRAEGDVFLRNVHAAGELRLLGARLGGDLSCTGARLKAGESGDALSANRAEISGTFFLRGGARIKGVLDLTAAEIGQISDDAACWPDAGNLILNRCRYGAFTGGPVAAGARTRWLDLQDPAPFGQDFWPQPWEHCAKVLREMGHVEDARQVLIGKEKRQRADRRRRLWRDRRVPRLLWAGFWDILLGITVRYGRQPLLAFFWLLVFWLAGAAIFQHAAEHHAIKPNNAFVLRSPEWAACHPDYTPPNDSPALAARWEEGYRSQLHCFTQQPEAAGYPQFNALVYSADTLLPIVAMEMQDYWIPDEAQGPRGRWTRYFLWLQIAMGWALSLLAVAGFSGLVKSD